MAGMKFSMNGFRTHLSDDVKQLTYIADALCCEAEWSDIDGLKRSLKKCVNSIVSDINTLNTLSDTDDNDFTDMSNIKILRIDDSEDELE